MGFFQIFWKNKKVLVVFSVLIIALLVLLIVSPARPAVRPYEVSAVAKAGETTNISLGLASLIVQSGSLRQDAVITMRAVPPPSLLPRDLQYVGETYELGSSQVSLGKPVVLTLRYGPAELPDPSKEDNLYIATWDGSQWVPVEGGVLNKADHSLTVAIDHFSLYTILCGVAETMFETIIESKSYDDLPPDIQVDLNYSKSDVAYVQRIEVPLAGKAASLTIAVSNVISKVSGIVIGGAQSEDELADALEETATQEIIGQNKVGELVVTVYSAAEGVEILHNIFQIATGAAEAAELSPPVVAAKAAAWILGAEMDYINDHVDEAWTNLWQMNALSTNRLELYLVYIEAPYKGGRDTRGVKYYYFDEMAQEYVNYYNDIASTEIEFNIEAQTPSEPAQPSEYVFSDKPPFDYPDGPNVEKGVIEEDQQLQRIGYSQTIHVCSGQHCQEQKYTSGNEIGDWYKEAAENAGWVVYENRMDYEIRQVSFKGDVFFICWILWGGKSSESGIDEDDSVINIEWGLYEPSEVSEADWQSLSEYR